jgi:hypothetical protein
MIRGNVAAGTAGVAGVAGVDGVDDVGVGGDGAVEASDGGCAAVLVTDTVADDGVESIALPSADDDLLSSSPSLLPARAHANSSVA